MRSQRASLDLVAAVALALLALAAALIPLEVWLRTVLLVPLVLAVSGYATLAALLPAADLPAAERVIYAVALSVAITVLGGIVVQLVLGLDRTVWAVLLATLTLSAALLARWRRNGVDFAAERGLHVPLPGVGSAAAVGLALGLAVWAIAISSAGARSERDAYAFTALWAQPAQRASAGGQAVRIGIDNHQGATASYELVVKQRGTAIAHRPIHLADGDRRRLRVAIAPISRVGPVLVTLHRNGEIYRHVYLESGAAP